MNLFETIRHPRRAIHSYSSRFILNPEVKAWARRGFASPSPDFVKRACLLRNGTKGATWVETGTLYGHTTEKLAQHGSHVVTLEPAIELFEMAKEKFKYTANVEVINGTSEDVFPALLRSLTGDVNFWLDGHFSGGPTFKGTSDTPIKEELRLIAQYQSNWGKTVVIVDDVRCFNPSIEEYSSYPSIDFLVDWAREHSYTYSIEHDMFVAVSK